MLTKWVKYFLCTILSLPISHAFAQVSITGPTCVIPGLGYQYNIGGINTDSVNINVCVTGGTITGSDSTCQNGKFSFIRITWTDSVSGSISLSSVQGNASFNVNMTEPLLPGDIDSSNTVQAVASDSIPSVIHCTEASGGSCAHSYSYQWQQSTTGDNWQDITGNTSADLQLSSPVSQTTYYRRKVKDIGNSIAFSIVAIILVKSSAE